MEARSNHSILNKCNIQSLNGSWNFSYNGSTKWRQIKVPGHMELQGYRSPQYVNTTYPWDGVEDLKPGEVPSDRINNYDRYRKKLEASKEWNRVYMKFDGVESSLELYYNGEFVGYSEDSFTESRFDLSGYIRKDSFHHTSHELENANHHYELQGGHTTNLNINLAQIGVGGDDSWGARLHQEYILSSDRDLNYPITSS